MLGGQSIQHLIFCPYIDCYMHPDYVTLINSEDSLQWKSQTHDLRSWWEPLPLRRNPGAGSHGLEPTTEIIDIIITEVYQRQISPFIKIMASTVRLPLPGGRVIGYRLSHPSPSTENRGRIVLLSNSLMAPYQTWEKYVDHLLSQNLNVLCYDQIGHGSSAITDSTAEATTFQNAGHGCAGVVRRT